MAQTAVPTTDTTIGPWKDNANGTTNIYTSIDETVAAAVNSDFIKSSSAPASEVYVTKLSALTDPVSSSSHVISANVSKDTAGGGVITVTVQLRQGYVSEVSPGTLIATLTCSDVASTWGTYTYTLSAAEADSITNYGDLYLRVIANQS